MKIAFCTEIFDPSLGGVEKRCYETVKRLKKYGHDVQVFTSSPKKIKGIKIKKISPFTLKTPPSRNLLYCIIYWIKLFFVLLKSDYDIIDANGHLSILPCSLAGKLKRKPVIATIHDLYLSDWKKMQRGISKYIGYFFEYITCKSPYTKIITVNKSIKKNLINKIKINPEKIIIIPNGITLKYIDDIRAKKAKKKSVIFVGRLTPQKNVKLLIKSFYKLKDKKVELKIIGQGSHYKKLLKLVKELNMKKRVKFLGKLKKYKDVIKEMKKSSVFVLPSIRESFGIVLIEAMASKTPVISTKTEGPREFIKEGINGYLTEINNEKELSEKMKKVLNDEKIAKDLIKEGRKTAEKYDWDNISKDIEKIYIENKQTP